ncbi:Heavy metal RND efflux outer membrane protein, CzcC family [hydrothermal vent metagenome]|uniref:Heavy metal RND efflux outer membrane protein, CzcC family n=1 Tax=hydrothermal vent metagenome TaxID=652676 RepID=A0A3B0XGF1_9ZZZZ
MRHSSFPRFFNKHLEYKNLFLAFILMLVILPISNVFALNLKQAEQIAIQADPSIEQFKAASLSFKEESTANDTLPDPKLRLGAINLPVDTFDLDQEAMTQLKVGVQQNFPAGDTLEIKSQQSTFLSNSALALANDAELKILRNVRETYLNLYYEILAHQIILETKTLFSDLVTITESIYASGRASASQQDVVLANLELARLDDRITKIQANEEGYRATLAQWIGDPAWNTISSDFPELPDLPEKVDLNLMIPQHPLIRSATAQVDASKQMIEMAKQAYKPGFSATVDYGFRSGNNPDNSSRADFLTALVSMDIPLFTENRQDKKVSANVQRTAAARHSKDDKLRRLKQYYEKNRYLWQRLGERKLLYENNLLTSAKNNTATALTAYQSGVSEFNTLMRAEITGLNVRLEDLRIRVDRASAQARLLYVTGDANGRSKGDSNETK